MTATTTSTDDGQPDEILNDDADDPIDFFQHHMAIINDAEHDDDDDDAQEAALPKKNKQPRKPLWWRQRAGQRGSKAQRRAYRTMAYKKLPSSLAYGELYNFEEIFSPLQQIWLEVGAGQGDVLLANAERNPRIAMIGADVYKPGICATLVRIEKALEANEYWKAYDEYDTSKDPYSQETQEEPELSSASSPLVTSPGDQEELYSNARVFPGDGMKLLKNSTPTASLDRILLTFPDPFPKDGQEEHRVLQTDTIQDIHNALKPNGRFFLATDHPTFHAWTLDLFDAASQQFRKVEPCPPRSTWLPVISKYEQKGWDEGRQTFLVCWEVIK